MADISSTELFVAAGIVIAPHVAGLVKDFFKGSVSRNVETADKAFEELKSDLREQDHRMHEVERRLERLDTSHDSHKSNMATALAQIDSRLQGLDHRIAEQGKAYEEKIVEGFKRIEIELNRKLAQVVSEPSRRR